MTCPNCGRNVPDGMQCSCRNTAVYSSNPAVNVLKREGASVRFLVLAILLSVSAVLSIFASSTVSDYFWDELYYNTYMDWDVYYAMSSIMSGVIAAIPTILMAIGLWMFYASSRNVSHGGVSTSGLTIIKVLMIIALVFLCLAGFIFAIAGVVIAFNPSLFYDGYYGYGYYYGAGIVTAAIFLVLGALVLLIVYITRVIKIINRVKRVATTGMPNNEISMFAVVMFYIFAGFNVISAFGSLTDMYISPLGILASLVSAGTFVVGALVLMKFRKEMTMLMYSNPPAYPGFTQQQPPVPGAYAPPVQQNVVYPNADVNQPYGQQSGYVPPQVNSWQTSQQANNTVAQPYGYQQPMGAAPVVPNSAEQTAEAAAKDVEEAKAVFSSEQLPSFDEIQSGMNSGDAAQPQSVVPEAAPVDEIRHGVEEQAESASEAAAKEVEEMLSSPDPFAPLSGIDGAEKTDE